MAKKQEKNRKLQDALMKITSSGIGCIQLLHYFLVHQRLLEGLRGEESITTLCRREGINPNLYYRWSKGFLEGGVKRV